MTDEPARRRRLLELVRRALLSIAAAIEDYLKH